MHKTKLTIVATHPIQYHAPWFRELAKQNQLDLLVLYGMMPTPEQQSIGFGNSFSWDIPLTDGYQWKCLENVADHANLSAFSGIDCPSIYNALKETNPDAVIITGWHSKLLLQTLFATHRLKIKTIMRGDSNAKKKRPWYIKLIHRLLLSNYHTFLAVGKSNQRFFINNGVKQEVIFQAPYFIENQRFIDGSSAHHVIDSQKKVNANKKFHFLYAGKLIEKKNVSELLIAFQHCYKQHTDIELLIIGDGKLRQQLESHAIAEKLPVRFHGFINQASLPATYALGDCFLLASDYDETWGLVVNEAMACGLPAIVSDRAGSSDDLIIQGKTGFVYEYGNALELSEKMIYMLENRESAKLMGQQAKEHVINNFNVDITVKATLDALEYLRES